MKLSLGEIAERVGGEVRGDPDILISNASPFETAVETDITLASDAKFLNHLEETAAGGIIVPDAYEGDAGNVILSGNPRVAFARATALFYPSPQPETSISDQSVMGEDVVYGDAFSLAPFVSIGSRVTIGDRVRIFPHVFIGDDVVIGDDVEIKPNVTIMERCSIGSRVIIHAGTVIGSDGFGFAPDGAKYQKVPHVGTVVIGDDVEIGANNTIDRATFGRTWIKRGVKTDNLIQIAHNVEIGEDSIVVAQAGIAGSTTIGNHVIIAGQAAISGHLTIGDNAVVGPRSGVAKSLPTGDVVMGAPSMPAKAFMRQSSLLKRLPDMKKKIGELEKKMRVFEKKAGNRNSEES